MSRPRSSTLTLSVLSIFLLFTVSVAAPNLAFAGPTLSVNPNSLSFVHVVVGTTSASQAVTATAMGGLISFPHGKPGITVTAPFLLTGNTCDTSLPQGKSCQVQVACKPTKVGAFNGTLTFNTAPASATKTVPLSCNAVLFATSGDVLVAGGDSGGFLGGVVPLATTTNSTASAEVYNAIADSFSAVGSLGTSREATANPSQGYAAVVLPNHKTLVVGGSHCFPKTINSTNGGPACGSSSFSGFECDALNTAELYSEGTSTFTPAGANSATPFTMTTARSGATATLLADGTVLISGGSTGSSFLALTPPPTGCGPPGQVAQNSAELYIPGTDTFTATTPIPGCPLGMAPPSCNGLPATCPVASTVPIAASPTGATESGTTVTITTNAAHGFFPGLSVTVAGVGNPGYNGSFTIASVPTTTTFTYTDSSSGLAASGGGAATSDTGFRQCGLIDSVASLLGPSAGVPFGVVVAGGDYLQFLGQSSQQSFVYVPSYDSLGPTPPAGTPFWFQTHPLTVPRELAAVTNLPSGNVLVAGGLTSAAGACVGTGTPPGSTPVAFTSNSSAEIFNPSTFAWTLTTGSSSTPGAPGGMSIPRLASAELFPSGPDAGKAILAGGVDAETTDGAGTNTFPTCEPVTNIAQTSETATDLFDESTGMFTATGALNQDRFGYAAAILNSGPNSGDVVVIGGACGTMPGSLASAPIGSLAAGGVCDGGSGTGFTDYYELFNPMTGAWTVGASAPASTPANTPATALLP